MNVFEILGIVFAGILVAVILFLLIVSIWTAYAIKKGTKHAKLLIFILLTLETPIKFFLKFFNISGREIDIFEIFLANKIFEQSYLKTPYQNRILFLPQCLRDSKCIAKLSPEKGIECISCNVSCLANKIKKEAEDLGYKVFIVPGSSFIKRIILKEKPKAILGVACIPEVKQGLELCMDFSIPAQGVPLTRAGCMNTQVDLDEVFEKIHMIQNA
ncbi:MAG: DUF116 domain-containing protein [archaeon]